MGAGLTMLSPAKVYRKMHSLIVPRRMATPTMPAMPLCRYAAIAGSEDRAAMRQAMNDVYFGRAVMPQEIMVTGPNWKDPNGVHKAQNGQAVMKGVGIAQGTLVGAAEVTLKPYDGTNSKATVGVAKASAKMLSGVLITVDAKLKFDELKAKGFSDGAAWRGVAAGQAVSLTFTQGGALIGAGLGGAAGSALGPGAFITAGLGRVGGGAIGGLIDWATGLSDDAALKAANLYDGKNIK
jgi:hypothetical protein